MSAILRRAVFAVRADDELDVDIGVYDLLKKTLSRQTKDMVDKSGIKLHMLAAIIDQTLAECKISLFGRSLIKEWPLCYKIISI